MKPQGFRCPGSHNGYPHGKDKKRARADRAKARAAAKEASCQQKSSALPAT